MFCKKCGSLLKTKQDDKGRSLEYCSCGYKKLVKDEHHIKEKIDHKDEKIIVRDAVDKLADYDHKCPKCGFGKARLISQAVAKTETWCRCEQTSVSVICGRCGHKTNLE